MSDFSTSDIMWGMDYLNKSSVEMIPVESSNLEEVGYDSGMSKLYVTFKSGSTYSYDDVEKQTFETLLEAPSKGSYFYWSIRMSYNYTKIS